MVGLVECALTRETSWCDDSPKECKETMEDKTAVLAAVCGALTDGQSANAAAILRSRYPFVPLSNVGRRYSVRQSFSIFVRDGFIDRYSGARRVFPATPRLISKRLPEVFPFQSNWRTDACHFAYWELSPTIDHPLPVSRGGADDESNWVTTSKGVPPGVPGPSSTPAGWRGSVSDCSKKVKSIYSGMRGDEGVFKNRHLHEGGGSLGGSTVTLWG